MEFSFGSFYGIFLSGSSTTEHILFLTPVVLIFLGLGYFGAHRVLWSIFAIASLAGLGAPFGLIYGVAAVATVFCVRPLRRSLVSSIMMKAMRALGVVPKISETEKAALNAGAVWVDADLFSGKPDWKKLMAEPYPELNAEERAYVDGPIEKLCELTDDWKIYQNKEIPQEVWDYMKKIKIFGMIIPKEYGGLGFSALAHSEVIMKLASRSIPVTITAMVPNSLGPAELLNHFGTKEQKDYYLPRLASGEEIPCFALTEPRAGSDAGSIESSGEIFEKEGKLFIRLNWNKRWITLAGVSTVLGMAFQLRDPNNVLGKGKDVGITCALIPSNTPGVVLGRRHDPMGVPFYNCPTQGKDVEIPVDWIIGGKANAGKGWAMLMESLGAGRGISLPSQAVGGSKLVARVTTAHTSIRKQFGLALCKLEGLEEPLARIGGFNYLLDAMRKYTVGALDKGIKPSVITAIAKQSSTEVARKVINDGMDIMAGSGISRGPRNLLSNIYLATPIGITVEGANILTRTMIIFGQGLLRAHPWAYKEVEALEKGDLNAFDIALWGHVGHVVNNKFRAFVLSITRGRVASAPVSRPLKRYAQKLSWASASFAILADIAMGTLGGELKKKEKLTGRFADILSWMYISTAVMKRYQAEGEQKEDLPLVHFSLRYALAQIQEAFDGIYANLKVPGANWLFKTVIRSWSRLNTFEVGFTDQLGQEASKAILERGGARDRLTAGIFYPEDPTQSLGRLERAYRIVKSSEETERKINKAIRKKILPKERVYKVIDEALEKNVINSQEAQDLKDAAFARWDACQVDDFTEEAYHGVEDSDIKQFRTEYQGPAGAPEFSKSKGSQQIA